MHFGAPGGGAFSASALALQFGASGGGNFTATLVLAIQRGRCAVGTLKYAATVGDALMC
jgi:hypothetical protein